MAMHAAAYWILEILVGTEAYWQVDRVGGASLTGVVVVKLFLFDLSNTGTVARVVSFLGVGVLLLVVGYFVPVPPVDFGSGRRERSGWRVKERPARQDRVRGRAAGRFPR